MLEISLTFFPDLVDSKIEQNIAPGISLIRGQFYSLNNENKLSAQVFWVSYLTLLSRLLLLLHIEKLSEKITLIFV